jgi:hypothetical protein
MGERTVPKKLEDRLPAYVRIVEVEGEVGYMVKFVPSADILSQGDAQDVGLWLLRASRVAGTLEKCRRRHGRAFVRAEFGLEESTCA